MRAIGGMRRRFFPKMKRLLILAWDFLWISTVTLGGGMAMLPFMDREFVERRKWLTEDEMTDIVAVMQSLPGLIAVNMAVLVGYRVKGILGAVVAAFAACLTPFATIAVIAGFLSTLTSSPTVDHIFLGVRAGTAALILISLVKLSKSVLSDAVSWVLAGIGFVAVVVLKLDVTWIVVFGFVIGIVFVIGQVVGRKGE